MTRGVGAARLSAERRRSAARGSCRCRRCPAPPCAAPAAHAWCACAGRGSAAIATLAGLKTLNRLESVLARAGMARPRAFGRACCATSTETSSAVPCRTCSCGAAVTLTTPLLDRCGVAGVMRRWVFEQAPALQACGPREAAHRPGRICEHAEEVFMTNAVAGIVPGGRSAGRGRTAAAGSHLARRRALRTRLGAPLKRVLARAAGRAGAGASARSCALRGTGMQSLDEPLERLGAAVRFKVPAGTPASRTSPPIWRARASSPSRGPGCCTRAGRVRALEHQGRRVRNRARHDAARSCSTKW